MSNALQPGRVPKYRRHKPTGQAVVTLNGRDFYLGKWNTKASRDEYDRLTGEWLAAGRSLPVVACDLTVAELALRFWKHAKVYYVKDGEPTSELDEYAQSLRPVRQLYGAALARDFGPLALKAIRQAMVDSGLTRGVVNHRVARLKRVFKWAVAEELLPAEAFQRLAAVEGLHKGRTSAREAAPVKPVKDEIVDATAPYLSPIVADMVRLQRLTGCRPGEVCIVRPCDVDTSGDVWQYRPASHKTEHHGHQRIIAIGPKGQDVLRPYLLRPADSYCFEPAESERKRHALRRENRRSPMTPSQSRRRRKHHARRAPGDRYTTTTYRRALERAVELANRNIKAEAEETGAEPQLLPNWHPNQLRHTAATSIRKLFGLEGSQVVLGHTSADVSQIYAERNLDLAVEVMRKIG